MNDEDKILLEETLANIDKELHRKGYTMEELIVGTRICGEIADRMGIRHLGERWITERKNQKLLSLVKQIRLDISEYFKKIDQPTIYAELMEQPTHLELGLQRIEEIANNK